MSYIPEIRALVGHRPLILTGAVVLIFDEEQRILLERRTDDNTWDLPGGFMEIEETIEETGRREVREETGLEIGEMTLFRICSGREYMYVCPNGDEVVPVSIVYVTKDVRGTLRLDGSEVSDLKYFPPDDLPGEMLPPVRQIIEEFLKTRGS